MISYDTCIIASLGHWTIGPISALDELEDDEDFATAGTDSRTQGAGDVQGIKAMEVCGSATGGSDIVNQSIHYSFIPGGVRTP